MKIYILTIVDLENVGFNPKDVEVFTDYTKANERMKELYLEQCKKYGIAEPFNEGAMGCDYGYGEGSYAYTTDHYFDIFEKEI